MEENYYQGEESDYLDMAMMVPPMKGQEQHAEQVKQSWLIEEDTVVEAIRANGFSCEKHKAARWFDTDVPVRFNKSYQLPDGRVLYSSGTSLHLQ